MTTPALIHRFSPGGRKTIPDYEVLAFYDAVAPGLKKGTIAEILGVERTMPGRWLRDGMPAGKARELVAWRYIEIAKQTAGIIDIIDQYQL